MPRGGRIASRPEGGVLGGRFAVCCRQCGGRCPANPAATAAPSAGPHTQTSGGAMMTNRRLTGLVATVLFAVAACSEPTSPSAPRILANVASPAGHYHVEFRSWIPQYWVVDPSVAGLPVSYAQSLLIPNFSNCWNPGWLAPITTVYSRWVGDNHVPYDGSYRTSTTVDSDWDGTNIANYTTNFYVGTSHRDLLYVWPGGLWWSGGWTECTVAHPGNLNHPASSASGPNFTFGSSGSDPFLPAPIPLFGQLWGSFSGTNLTLTWSTGQFPSFGVRVQGPFGSYTKTVNDARSEEHTSELQSRLHLVCRLLLEKKKTEQHNPRS